MSFAGSSASSPIQRGVGPTLESKYTAEAGRGQQKAPDVVAKIYRRAVGKACRVWTTCASGNGMQVNGNESHVAAGAGAAC
jgi:hypothetical protein